VYFGTLAISEQRSDRRGGCDTSGKDGL